MKMYKQGEHSNLANRIEAGINSFKKPHPVELNPFTKAQAFLDQKIFELRVNRKGFAKSHNGVESVEHSHRVVAPLIWASLITVGPVFGLVSNSLFNIALHSTTKLDETPKSELNTTETKFGAVIKPNINPLHTKDHAFKEKNISH
jgi:hypothetical protein